MKLGHGFYLGSLAKAILCIVILAGLGCNRFDNDKDTVVECSEASLDGGLLLVGLDDGSGFSTIDVLDAATLEEVYAVPTPDDAVFSIRFDPGIQRFYYTYTADRDGNKEAFIRRNLNDGSRVDSMGVPLGALMYQVDDYYMAYGQQSFGFYVNAERELIPYSFPEILGPLHTVNDTTYTVFRRNGAYIFGTADSAGVTDIFDMTEIIRSALPSAGSLVDILVLEHGERVLFTIGDRARFPLVVLFDVDITTAINSVTFGLQSSKLHHYPEANLVFPSSRFTFSLNGQLITSLDAYDLDARSMVQVLDLENLLGGEAFIQSMSFWGCDLFLGLLVRDNEFRLTSELVRYNFSQEKIM